VSQSFNNYPKEREGARQKKKINIVDFTDKKGDNVKQKMKYFLLSNNVRNPKEAADYRNYVCPLNSSKQQGKRRSSKMLNRVNIMNTMNIPHKVIDRKISDYFQVSKKALLAPTNFEMKKY
jgi:hypothetical protein